MILVLVVVLVAQADVLAVLKDVAVDAPQHALQGAQKHVQHPVIWVAVECLFL